MTSRSTRSRHRQRDGLIVLGDMVVPEDNLVAVLIASKRLPADKADDKQAITEAVRKLLMSLIPADVYFD